jgi:hypothetical protein
VALYNKDRAGVRGGAKARSADPNAPALRLVSPDGELLSEHDRPRGFCTAIRGALERAGSLTEISRLWDHNAETLTLLRALWPDLKTAQGAHYADVIEKLHRHQVEKLNTGTANQPRRNEPTPGPAMPRRLRDATHLQFVAELPCIVCGRMPSQAHHLLFAQPRAMGRKVSDEWTVPLCLLHHRALHDAGNEERWWEERRIDARAEAEALWQQSRSNHHRQADNSKFVSEQTAALVTEGMPTPAIQSQDETAGDAAQGAE